MAPRFTHAVRRILIQGSAGAGKSTLAIELGALLGLPVIHLDTHFWQPGWREPARDHWKRRVATLIEQDAWIMDGNYLGTISERLAAADTAIVLDVPRTRCIVRVIRRGFRDRGKPRVDLPEGCVEQLPSWQFIRWIWTFRRAELQPLLEQVRAGFGSTTVVLLRSNVEIRKYVKEVTVRG